MVILSIYSEFVQFKARQLIDKLTKREARHAKCGPAAPRSVPLCLCSYRDEGRGRMLICLRDYKFFGQCVYFHKVKC